MSHEESLYGQKLNFLHFCMNLISLIFLFTVTLRWVSLTWMPSPRMAMYTLKVIQWNHIIVNLNKMDFLLFNESKVKGLVIGNFHEMSDIQIHYIKTCCLV